MRRLIENWLGGVVNQAVDTTIRRLIRDQYTENLFEMVPSITKVGAINLMELAMRASRGTPVTRPLGSPLHLSPWDTVLFNPVHLSRFPTPENVGISTTVTIGPRAKRPLTIAIPIMIAGMSFGGALSKKAKIALALGASKVGTATNTGEAGLLEEEREAASLLIGQFNRGGWLNQPEKYQRLDAIEIQLGQGAQGSAPQRTAAHNIGPDYRRVFELERGQDAQIHSRLPGVNTHEEFVDLVRRLREETGVPVGLKIAATHHLEQEMAVALEAGVDFITVDGAEGGTHGGSPTLQDDLGLPTLVAVSRASRFLARKGALDDVSLIATGGLITPGQMLKAMALGASAVYIGTAAVMSMVGDQITKSMPPEPPTSLVVYTGKMTEKLDVEHSARNLQRFLTACVTEMEQVATSLGKTALRDVGKSDLCTVDPFLSRAVGIPFAYVPPEAQDDFFTDLAPVLPLQETPEVYPPSI